MSQFRTIILLFVVCSPAVVLQEDEARVVRVIDGDTIVITGDVHVRYIGVDTPELRGSEFYAWEATEINKKLVNRRVVRIEYGRDRFDRYDRTLAYVFVSTDSTELFVNDYLVRYGFARVLTIRPNVRYRALFEQSERFARAERLGIWGVKVSLRK